MIARLVGGTCVPTIHNWYLRRVCKSHPKKLLNSPISKNSTLRLQKPEDSTKTGKRMWSRSRKWTLDARMRANWTVKIYTVGAIMAINNNNNNNNNNWQLTLLAKDGLIAQQIHYQLIPNANQILSRTRRRCPSDTRIKCTNTYNLLE
jgi:hypothetical protein